MNDNLPSPQDVEMFTRIDQWYKENHRYLKLDECYGISMIAEVTILVRDCIAISKKYE